MIAFLHHKEKLKWKENLLYKLKLEHTRRQHLTLKGINQAIKKLSKQWHLLTNTVDSNISIEQGQKCKAK